MYMLKSLLNSDLILNFNKITFFSFIILFNACSSPEYVNVVKERMRGANISLSPEIIVSYKITDKGYRPAKYQDFHSNGETHLIGNFKGDSAEPIRTGTWNQYHSDGKIFATGNYENDKKTSKWMYYHKNGEKAGVGAYVNGQRNKYWKYFYSDGKNSQKQEFNMGVLNGEYNVWYSSGNKSIDGNYYNNMKDSLWNTYYDNEEELIYSKVMRDNDRISNYSVYYENGNKLSEGGTYGYYTEKNGSYKLWHENGTQAYEESFLDGKSNTDAKNWDENGNLFYNETLNENIHTIESGGTKLIITYNNENNSKIKRVDISYTLKTETNSVFGGESLSVSAFMEPKGSNWDRFNKFSGKWTAKYSSGTTAGIIKYTDGGKTGNWQTYKPNGKLVSKIKYNSDGYWTEIIDKNGYKWVVNNPRDSRYYQRVICPKGKKIRKDNVLSTSKSYVCHIECRQSIDTWSMYAIKKEYEELLKDINEKNKNHIDSFNFTLETPDPEGYDIEDPILDIKLPFELRD